MKIEEKKLGKDKETGLDKVVAINDRVVIDIRNKKVTLGGSENLISPTGSVVKSTAFSLVIENKPATKEVRAPGTVDGATGKMIPGKVIQEATEAGTLFDEFTNSDAGKAISKVIKDALKDVKDL